MSKKEFQRVSKEERYNLIYKVCESFVEHKSALVVDIMDKKVNPRQEFEDLFDFKNIKLRKDVYEKVRDTLTEKVLSVNPSYTLSSYVEMETQETVLDYVETWIKGFVKSIKRRSENGIVTWEDFKNHLHSVDLRNSPFGIRVQTFGKTYSEIHFNYMLDSGDCIKLYNAEWQDDDAEDEAIIDTASYVAISNKDIEEIWIGNADLIYQSGLRNAHIKYNNGEVIFFRFSEEN